MSYFKG